MVYLLPTIITCNCDMWKKNVNFEQSSRSGRVESVGWLAGWPAFGWVHSPKICESSLKAKPAGKGIGCTQKDNIFICASIIGHHYTNYIKQHKRTHRQSKNNTNNNNNKVSIETTTNVFKWKFKQSPWY